MTTAALPLALGTIEERDLAQHVSAGNTAAFEGLMRKHNRLLYRTARGIVRDDREAEDVVQEAYLLAYRSLGNFRGEARLSTWLVRIVVNEALGRLRKRKREDGTVSLENVVSLEQHMTAGSASATSAEPPEAAVLRTQLRNLLEQKIDRLPVHFRSVFVLRALEEMTVEETATCLDIPPATVRTRYFRARSLLREALDQQIDLALEDTFAFEGARCDRIVAAVLNAVVLRSVPAPDG